MIPYRHAATDPTRPATTTDKRLLAEALQHVPESAWRARMERKYPCKDRGDLNHGECEEIKAWAVRTWVA